MGRALALTLYGVSLPEVNAAFLHDALQDRFIVAGGVDARLVGI